MGFRRHRCGNTNGVIYGEGAKADSASDCGKNQWATVSGMNKHIKWRNNQVINQTSMKKANKEAYHSIQIIKIMKY